jgi:glucuronate isomerase
VIGDQDKKYLFNLLQVVIKTFGTDDTEWFCATETILNTLFNVKTRNSPEYARTIIQELTKKLYSDKPTLARSENELEELKAS